MLACVGACVNASMCVCVCACVRACVRICLPERHLNIRTYVVSSICRVGQTLVLPASVVVDYFIRHYTLKWFAFIGIALIVAGFVGFNVSYLWQEKTESKGSHKHQGGDAKARKTGLEAFEKDNSPINYSHESNSTVNSSSDEITELLPRKNKQPLKFRIKYLKYII